MLILVAMLSPKGDKKEKSVVFYQMQTYLQTKLHFDPWMVSLSMQEPVDPKDCAHSCKVEGFAVVRCAGQSLEV